MSSITIELLDDEIGKEGLSYSEEELIDKEEEDISSHSEQGDPFGTLIKTSNNHELTTLGSNS